MHKIVGLAQGKNILARGPVDVDPAPSRSTESRRITPTAKEHKMQYLLLIYENEAETAKRGEAGMKTMMNEYQAFTQSIIQAGQFKPCSRPPRLPRSRCAAARC
jgi:hypothetical protein